MNELLELIDLIFVFFHSSWWTRPTLLRYPPPVSSCCQYFLPSLCTASLCLFSSTRGDTLQHLHSLNHSCKMLGSADYVSTAAVLSLSKSRSCHCLFSYFCSCFHLFIRDMPCTMSLVEIKSLFRMDDIVASATQPITTLELSAHSGQGLQEVLNWLESITVK